MSAPRTLLAGCGDIAQRLAPLLRARGHQLTGLRRNAAALPADIAPLAVDLTDAAAVQAALADQRFDYVVITLTPGGRTADHYRRIYVEGTRHLLRALAGAPRILFVSSTSVYAQDAGERVDENSEAIGNGATGAILCEAEQLVRASGFLASSVRFSGIYGPGRERTLRMVREGRIDPAQAAQWSNRIHVDDCARVLDFLIDRWARGETVHDGYVASDSLPVQLGDVWQWLAQAMSCADPLAAVDWRAQAQSGKRCDSTRLQQQGFSWLYPDYRQGYASLLDR